MWLVIPELARTAQTTVETIATDNNGSYASVSPTELNKYEKSITFVASGSCTEATGTCIKAASGTGSTEYTVTAESPVTKDTFTITDKEGEIKRTCVAAGSNKGGCPASSW